MILELCKGVHCVDLDESFRTHIYLQNLASIQPRTSPVKFVGSRGSDLVRGVGAGRSSSRAEEVRGTKTNVNVHLKDKTGQTALHHAAAQGLKVTSPPTTSRTICRDRGCNFELGAM